MTPYPAVTMKDPARYTIVVDGKKIAENVTIDVNASEALGLSRPIVPHVEIPRWPRRRPAITTSATLPQTPAAETKAAFNAGAIAAAQDRRARRAAKRRRASMQA